MGVWQPPAAGLVRTLNLFKISAGRVLDEEGRLSLAAVDMTEIKPINDAYLAYVALAQRRDWKNPWGHAE